MDGLPRPDVPPGPRRDLVDALHDLHHRTGWPSLRALAREAGCSHTTVSGVFSSPRLPSWGTLELLVEAMQGDTDAFHTLWLAASSQNGSGHPTPTVAIAGRAGELSTIRDHLGTGRGFLLVTGEAGIGKTTLVTTAAATTDTFVATGSCLPLSSEVPLLPVADALRAVHDADDGRWLGRALSACAPYVRTSVSLLVPELARSDSPTPGDDVASARLFAAVEATLRALSTERRLALLVEDLHWADLTTLDLLEHLSTRWPDVTLVGSWRRDDPTTDEQHLQWFNRIRRAPHATSLVLGPLDREGTRAQLAQLTGHRPSDALVDSIYERTRGQPLFTEQLALHAGELPLPTLLADLLDARLGDLAGPAWSVARALGVADRPLTGPQLAAVTGLAEPDLGAGLHELDRRHLLSPASAGEAALRHPLLAEAIRRRLVAGEAVGQHAAVARGLATAPEAEPAEIARHWQAADDAQEELVWRIRAAKAAHARFAMRNEAEQWVRALELWPDGAAEAGRPAVSRYEALVSVLDVCGDIDRDRVADLAVDALALLPGLPAVEAATLLQRVGSYYVEFGDIDTGLDLLHRAVAIYEQGPPGDGLVRTLHGLELAMRGVGHRQEAGATVARAVEVCADLEDRRWYRTMLVRQAWHEAQQGETSTAISHAREAAEVPVTGHDPRGEARLAAAHTELLLLTGADPEEVLAAGQRGLDAAEIWDLNTYPVIMTRSHMSTALRLSGQVARAARLIEPFTTAGPAPYRWFLYLERAHLDLLQGRTGAAAALVDRLREMTMPSSWLDERTVVATYLAGVDVWLGRGEALLDLVTPVIEQAADTEVARDLGPLLTLAARGAADSPTGAGQLERLTSLHASCPTDPFASRPVPVDARAWAATWGAELTRLTDRQSVEPWVAAAASWDRIARPHDAAYCRWRAAQVALATGEGTIAARLLLRARTGAHEHIPLLRAIDELRVR